MRSPRLWRLTRHQHVAAVVASGRARWKIENENNNTLKTKGYHFEHNFGHGKQFLSSLLATLILLAFLLHTLLDLMDNKFCLLLQKLPSRRRLFDDMKALTTVCALIAGSICSILCWRAGLMTRKAQSFGL